jgi:hypothetical protein
MVLSVVVGHEFTHGIGLEERRGTRTSTTWWCGTVKPFPKRSTTVEGFLIRKRIYILQSTAAAVATRVA